MPGGVSRVLRQVAYDPVSQRLLVTFKSGAVYCYTGVPPVVFAALLAAESQGRYFGQEIRDRYPYALLNETDQARFKRAGILKDQ